MVTIDCTASPHDGVTLVTVRLRDIDVPTRVRVESRLDGPVWPPRREGLPEPGWTDTGFDGVVEPDTETLGYATPAAPADPPAELVDVEPVPDADGREELTTEPASVVRQLGDPSPPADAVPAGEQSERAVTADAAASDSPEVGATEPPKAVDAPAGDDGSPPADGEQADLPAAVGPWLAEMARRTDRAERLARAETVPAATEAVRAAGGMPGVRELAAAEDTQQLRALARRARKLAERRDGATVPVDTLATLA